MKPSFTPLAFSNCSPRALRSFTTSARFTSLNEVSIAIEFFDCIRRSAMRVRMRVIATRSSGRLPGVGLAAGAAAAAGAALPPLPALTRSSLVTRPSRPVPATFDGSMFSSTATRRPAGESSSTPAGAAGASALAAFGASAAAGAAAGAGAAAAAAPSSITAITWLLVTVEPSSNLISFSTPSTGEGTSSTTLSVSRSSRFSSRLTASPAFLCQVAMSAAETHWGRTGTLTSMDMLVLLRCVIGADRRDERLLDERRLFGDMGIEVASGRRRGASTSRIGQAVLRTHAGLQVVTDLEPGALVHRFFLAPHHFLRGRVLFQFGRDFRARERIQLLDAHDGDVGEATLLGVLEQVVVDLARAQHDALDLLRREIAVLADDQLELAVGQFVERRHGQLVAQQGFRRHHDQRLAHRAHLLAADHMERLGRRGRHADLHVFHRAQLQEALEAGGGVLRAPGVLTIAAG